MNKFRCILLSLVPVALFFCAPCGAAALEDSVAEPPLVLMGRTALAVPTASAGPVLEAWREVARHHAENGGMRTVEARLPSHTLGQWNTMKSRFPAMSEEERLRAVNGFFNKALSGGSDEALYGKKEYWASPAEFLEKGRGDCEDYAIIKYYALVSLGVRPESLRLVLVYDQSRNSAHAVLAAKTKKDIFILDNLSSPAYLIMPHNTYKSLYAPLFAVNDFGASEFPQSSLPPLDAEKRGVTLK